jgi:hypothetical protein
MNPASPYAEPSKTPSCYELRLQDHLGTHGAPSCWQLWGNHCNLMS